MQGFDQNITVDVHDVDFNGVCRTSSLMKYIQSTAQLQLTENGMSYEQLRNRGRAFIISKIRLEFYSSVRTYEKLTAKTFPCVSRGFSFLRCYSLERDGETVGRAISVWALIDTETRSLVKVNDFDLNLPTYEPYDLALSHFRMPDTLREVGKYTVTYADLDQNKHINNTKYADIFSNFLPLDGKRIETITINYKNEAVFGDVLSVFLTECDGTYYIRTVRPDGKINSEAEIRLCDI
jgi:acyl-ACP thioesterase